MRASKQKRKASKLRPTCPCEGEVVRACKAGQLGGVVKKKLILIDITQGNRFFNSVGSSGGSGSSGNVSDQEGECSDVIGLDKKIYITGGVRDGKKERKKERKESGKGEGRYLWLALALS